MSGLLIHFVCFLLQSIIIKIAQKGLIILIDNNKFIIFMHSTRHSASIFSTLFTFFMFTISSLVLSHCLDS